MPRTKKKLRRLQLLSWIFLLGPITGVVVYNFKDYFSAKQGLIFTQSVEVGIGTVLATFCGVMLALGKTNALKGSRGLIIALLLAMFLKSILNDLILILSALSAGSVVFEGFKPFITTTKDIYIAERNANINAIALNNVMNGDSNQTKKKGLSRV